MLFRCQALRLLGVETRAAAGIPHLAARPIHATPVIRAVRFAPRLVLKEEDIHEAFVHGSGPGGQKINKTACAVQLKHIPTGITTMSQATRSRTQNRKIARRILAEKVEQLEKGDQSRTAIKARIKSDKKASKTKKARRKYRALATERSGEGGDVEPGEGELADEQEENSEENTKDPQESKVREREGGSAFSSL